MTRKNIHYLKSLLSSLFLAVFALLAACNNNSEPVEEVSFTNLESLEGHSVAVIAGSTSDLLLGDTNNFTNIKLFRCSTSAQLVAALLDDSVECAITDTVVFNSLCMQSLGLTSNFNLPGGFDVAAAFKHDDKKLCNQFNDFLVQIKSDGTLDEMIQRWCNGPLDTAAMPVLPGLPQLKGHPLEVATLSDNPPFSFYCNNNLTGFEVEMMLRFGIFANRPIHFSGYNFDEVMSIVLNGKADMAAANIFITPDRSDRLLFSHPYYFCKTCCISKTR